ncbi:hypothetical protein CZ774_11160 [Frigoribacterium sp. JB110]|nr:hypothetical protein CZ774_11160 [Frigoribacterium sp. JB110]
MYASARHLLYVGAEQLPVLSLTGPGSRIFGRNVVHNWVRQHIVVRA